jgi:hypothetical protein
MAEAETLEAKRSHLEAELAALKLDPAAADLVRKADAAVAQHRAKADALEAKMADVDAQMGVRELDRRAAAAKEKRETWLAMRQELLQQEERRLQAVEEAEQSTRGLVRAIEAIMDANASMARLAHELSADRRVPAGLSPIDLAKRTSMRIAAVLSSIKGYRHRYGALEFPAGASSLYPSDGPAWKDQEEQLLSRAVIGKLLEEGKA